MSDTHKLQGIERKHNRQTNFVSFRLEDELAELVAKVAKRENTTKSEIYRYSIKDLLKKLNLL